MRSIPPPAESVVLYKDGASLLDVWLLLSFLCVYIYKNIYFKLYRSTSQQHRKDEFKYQLLIALFKIQIVLSFEALINKNKEDHISCQKCLYIGWVKSDRKLDGAETHRGYVLKNATNARSHKYTHYSIYTPPYPHTPTCNRLLLVSSLYKMYTGIHLLTAVLKEGWMWKVWGEVWHWEVERRWSRRKRSTMRRSTSRRRRLDWQRGQRQLWCWWRGAAEAPPGLWGKACRTPRTGVLTGAGPAAGAGETGCTAGAGGADAHSAGREERWEIVSKAAEFVHRWYYMRWVPL